MIIVKPIQITDAILDSSSIAEPDSGFGEAVWLVGTTYNTGDEVILASTHRIYRSAIDSNTGNDPATDDGTKWVDIQATNRWRMFDGQIGAQSTGDDVTITLTPGQLFNAVAGLNITDAESINVTVTDPVEGVVYDRDIEMIDNSAVVDYYEYFFSPIISIREFALFDLPPYPSADLTITMVGTGIGVGEILTGQQINVGTTQYGTSWKPSQFGLRERDEFGNFIVQIYATTDIMDFSVKIPKGRYPYVRQQLSSLGDEPTLWAGTLAGNDGTIVYGYYDSININFSSPSLYDATISVQGLT